MNLLFVTTRYGEGLGGKENALARLAGALAARGHAVRVVARADDAFPEFSGAARFTTWRSHPCRPHAADVRILAPGPGRAWAWPAYRLHFVDALFGVAAACFERAVRGGLAEHVGWSDVVHYDGTGRELLGHAALAACRRQGKSFVVCPHMHPGSWGDSAPDLALYREADGVIAKTAYEAGVLACGGVRPERVAVIGNGPQLPVAGDPRALAERLGPGGPVVLFLGRRTAAKGYPQLVAAMERVRARVPDARLVALAPADDPAPCVAAPQPWLHELPGAPEDVKDAAYRLAAVVCLPSAAEAFGMVIVEAWSHGVPVVVSRIPALAEVVTDGEDGLLTEREPDKIADALLRLLADPALARQLGEAGRAKAAARFTWEAVAASAEAHYNRCRGRAP